MLAAVSGCGNDQRFKTPPLSTLAAELRNPDYRWKGPCSREDRIPVSHAARALAYVGDDAVPTLLEALEDPDVRVICIVDALSEIGIPVEQFRDDLMKRDPSSVQLWWAQNANDTIPARSAYRLEIALPTVQ